MQNGEGVGKRGNGKGNGKGNGFREGKKGEGKKGEGKGGRGRVRERGNLLHEAGINASV